MALVTITIDHTKILSPLTDFPLPVHLSADSGSNGANLTSFFDALNYSMRKKLAVTTAGGQQCYVEIAWWDDVARQALLYVLVPNVYSTVDTILQLVYDAAAADNTSYVGDVRSVPGERVWANFAAVYHLTEQGNGTPGEFRDSTSGHHDGQAKGGSKIPTRVLNELGLPVQSFDGADDYIIIPDADVFSLPTPGTFIQTHNISLADLNWGDSGPGLLYYMGKIKPHAANFEWFWQYANNNNASRPECWNWYVGSPDSSLQATANINYPKSIELAVNQWYHNGVICKTTSPTSGTMKAYQDGLHSGQESTFANYGVNYVNGPASLCIGNYLDEIVSHPLKGRMSEVRFANFTLDYTVPRQAWLTADAWAAEDNLVAYEIDFQPPAGNVFPAGAPKTPTAPISVTAANLPCTAEIFLGPDPQHKAATSGQISFTSSLTPVNVAMPVIMPSVNGTYHVYIDVAYQGAVFASFQSITDVTIIGGSIGPIVWS